MNKTILRTANIDLDEILSGEIIEEREFMYEIDEAKAFKKLAGKQFVNPALALRELVSNALDSYTGLGIKPMVDILLTRNEFEILDYGTGFTEDKIQCLRTLGDSDKRGKEGFIGRFGIGFASLFHPDLKIEDVFVDTKIEDRYERLHFEVKETEVSLKRYLLDGTFDFSTRIHGNFKSLDYDMEKRIRETLINEAKYMNSTITLNGSDIGGTALFDRTRKYMLNFEGDISGRICFFDPSDESEKDTRSKVAVLSHDIYVSSAINYEMVTGKFRPPAFFGFVNHDDLSVITSRNKFKLDDKYKRFVSLASRQIRKRFREMCAELSVNKDTTLRNILQNAYDYNETKFQDYAPDKVKDSCLRALAEAPIFTAWNRTGSFSMNDLYSIANAQGHLLCSSSEESIELFEIQDYAGPIIKIDYYPLTFEGAQSYSLNNLYNYNHQINEKFYQKLIDEGILDPEKLKTELKLVDDGNLSRKEMNFITGLRDLLKDEHVKDVLEQMHLATEYNLNVADITPTGIVACYEHMTRSIFVNRKNSISAQYMMENDGKTAEFYLPIFAHELGHNVLGRHNNPFYELADQLSLKLSLAIAESKCC